MARDHIERQIADFDNSICIGSGSFGDLSSEEISEIASGNQVEKEGVCGKWKNFASGCFYAVENGKVEKVCAD